MIRAAILGILLAFSGPAIGQDPVEAEIVQPDAGAQGTDAQIQQNTARLDVQERMSGNQDFILKLLGILVPAIVLIMQIKQGATIRKVQASVNGMKDELVTEVRKAALLQGAETERTSHPKAKKAAKVRKRA